MLFWSQDSKYLRVASTNDTSKESFGEEKENEITINVPSKKELERNRDLFTNVLKRLREGCLKEDLSTSTRENLSEGDELTHMSFEEIALYVDTKARKVYRIMLSNHVYKETKNCPQIVWNATVTEYCSLSSSCCLTSSTGSLPWMLLPTDTSLESAQCQTMLLILVDI